MRCGVVTAYSRAGCLVNGKRYAVACVQTALFHGYLVHIIAVGGFCGVGNFCLCGVGTKRSSVAHLTAHFSIERCFVGYYKAFLTCGDSVCFALALYYYADNLCVSGKLCIAHKLGRLAVKFICFVAVPA